MSGNLVSLSESGKFLWIIKKTFSCNLRNEPLNTIKNNSVQIRLHGPLLAGWKRMLRTSCEWSCVVLCCGRRTHQKATAACRVQVKCETYYFICYQCPRRRRHFWSAGTRNQAETTKGSVQQKLNTLRQLAAEILAIVAEEEIEGEIERADLLEENVQLVIANIENALSPKVACSNVKNGAYVSEST